MKRIISGLIFVGGAIFTLFLLLTFIKTSEKALTKIDQGIFISTSCEIQNNKDVIFTKVHGFVDGRLRERSIRLHDWPQEIFPGDKVRIITTDKGEVTIEKIIPGWND